MIEVDDLSFSYPGASGPTLRGLSFSIASGEVYGLLGPSGAGKSTTQRILMGLLRGFTGEVRVFGEPIGKMGRALYERIGVSFELPALYLRLTAMENLRLFASLYEGKTLDPREILQEVDLLDAADQRVDQFSKGMKMRLNLARSLLHDPDLLFLDEPTTGQDPARSRSTRELLRRLKSRGKTIFLTTHNMAEAEEVCDRVGFLVGGKIPVTGSPADLKRDFGQDRIDVATKDGPIVEHRVFPLAGVGANAEFLALLRERSVVSIHSQEASLDDVFIKSVSKP
ncbi:MAG: ABC transporter ATP-binding protein [Devosia sp.]